jgi:phage shock protein A
MTEASDSEVERLYGVSLDEFTPARDETSRRLRDEGRREDAAAIKALRKPSNPAWVINRLAREVPKIIDNLLAAGQRLRDTQLSGGGSLQDAMEGERAALDRAMRNAEEIATHAGLASASTLQRVRETLHLAALDADVAADVKRGVLAREGRATGFTGLAGLAPQVEPPKPGKPKTPPTAERPDPARARRLAKARGKAATAEQDMRDAERELADADRQLAAATRNQQRAQGRVQRARDRCEAAQEQVASLEDRPAST